jgi:hypothetical protein
MVRNGWTRVSDGARSVTIIDVLPAKAESGPKERPRPVASNRGALMDFLKGRSGNDVDHKARITYREFYDVPRMIIVNHRGRKLLLDCKFDESLDEYAAAYKVYVLPAGIDEQLVQSWDALPEKAAEYLGDVPVDQVIFDPSKRAEIDTRVIDSLCARS